MRKGRFKMRFSVVVPVYNVATVVGRCMKSILSQTFHDYEIIIVDDGSTDGSGEIVDRYAKNNDNIRVIHKPNDGPYMARVDGINAAHGEYLIFVDSDDFLVPFALASLDQLVRDSPEIDMVIYRHQVVECDNNGFIKSHKDGIKLFDEGYINKNEIIKECASDDNFYNIWLKCVKNKHDLNFAVYHHLNMAEDLALTCQFVKYFSTYYYDDNVLYNYVVNPDSLTHKVNMTHLMSAADARTELLKLLNSVGKINEYKDKIINDYVKNLTWYISEMDDEQLLSNEFTDTIKYVKKSPIWLFTLENVGSANKANQIFISLIKANKYKQIRLIGRFGRRLKNHGKLYKV